jgi:hypothetical protein
MCLRAANRIQFTNSLLVNTLTVNLYLCISFMFESLKLIRTSLLLVIYFLMNKERKKEKSYHLSPMKERLEAID